jgi:hypothetical protein
VRRAAVFSWAVGCPARGCRVDGGLARVVARDRASSASDSAVTHDDRRRRGRAGGRVYAGPIGGTGPPSASDEGVAWQAAAMYARFKGRVMTGQSCPPPPLTLALLHASGGPQGAGDTSFPRKALLGWQVPLAGLSTVTRVGIAACVQEKVGGTVRGLMRRAAVAAGPAVLLGPAAGPQRPLALWCRGGRSHPCPTHRSRPASCAGCRAPGRIHAWRLGCMSRPRAGEPAWPSRGMAPPGRSCPHRIRLGPPLPPCLAWRARRLARALSRASPRPWRSAGTAWRGVSLANRASALWPAHACRLAPS